MNETQATDHLGCDKILVTTVLVRRMLFWTPVTAGFVLTGAGGLPHAGFFAFILGFPFFVSAYVLILGIVAAFALRTAPILVERPVFFGSWLRPSMWLADALWAVEAGSSYGSAQAEQSRRGLDRALYDSFRELERRPMPPGHVWIPVLAAHSEGWGPWWHSAVVAAIVAGSAQAFFWLSTGGPM